MSSTRIHVLAVDDEPDLCTLTKEFLERSEDFEVDLACSVKEAREAFNKNRYDAVVSDYQMPGEDGIQFLKSIRASGNKTPFILLTGKGREEVVIEALNNGVDSYMQKGWEPVSQYAELEHRIRSLVSRHRSEEELGRSPQMLQLVLDSVPQRIFWKDLHSNFIGCNKNAAVGVGLSEPKDMVGKSDFDIVQKEAAEQYQRDDRQVMESGIPKINFEERLLPLDSGERWIRTSKVPLKDSNGNVIGVMGSYEDITDLKEAEGALKQSEERFRNLADNAFEGIGINVDGIVVDANRALSEILGYEPDELISMSIFDLLTPESREIAQGHIIRNSSESYEAQAIKKNGDIIYVQLRGKQISWKGRTARLSSVQDVTERKRTAVTLIANEKKLSLMTDHMKDGIWLLDMQLKPTWMSPSVFHYSGFTLEELTNTPIDRQMTSQSFQKVSAAIQALMTPENLADPNKELSFAGELEFFRKDGGTIWIDTVYSVMRDEMRRPTGVLGVGRDISERKKVETELKESEEFHRHLASSISVGIVIIDPVTRNIESVNEAAATMFGSEREKIVGRRCHSFLCPALEGACPVCDCGKEVDNSERVMICADGSKRPVLKTVKRTTLRGQEKLLECFLDISERKQAEDALRQANRKLNLLTSITRHDINNQTSSLEGHLALLEMNQPGLTSDEHFKKAETAARRISAMIHFTKEYEDIGVNAPRWQNIQKIIEICAKEVPMGKIHIANDLPSNVELYADPLIIKVFHNLLDNAVRHGDKITTLQFSLENKDRVRIVYQDDGVGINAATKQNLFSKGSGKDHGFGLFLSREILAITGITIEEEGETGEGAKFVMTVPPEGIRESAMVKS